MVKSFTSCLSNSVNRPLSVRQALVSRMGWECCGESLFYPRLKSVRGRLGFSDLFPKTYRTEILRQDVEPHSRVGLYDVSVFFFSSSQTYHSDDCTSLVLQGNTVIWQWRCLKRKIPLGVSPSTKELCKMSSMVLNKRLRLCQTTHTYLVNVVVPYPRSLKGE